MDFVKTRFEEVRAENHLLLETKQELEFQLSTKDGSISKLVEYEKELERTKSLLAKTMTVRGHNMASVFYVYYHLISFFSSFQMNSFFQNSR